MKAVVLARGLGTRMREADPEARLSDPQRRAADAGLKPMIPINGRPFLDYLLSALADAGVAQVALVVAPDHEGVRRHYSTNPPARIALGFVVQPEPLGTANAVLAAETWAAGDPFLAMNADNLYPVTALADLVSLGEPGLPAFEHDDLVRSGNIPAERVQAFAVIEVDAQGYLTRIVEKPASLVLPPEGGSHKDQHKDEPVASAFRRKDDVLVSMNCWRFDSRIFGACRDVPRSARGEFELPEAVGLAARRGVRFKALRARGAVLDLSRRADTADVERRLAGVVPRP
jgi:dTDP-glucose pyrophosphorylase